MKFSNFFQKYEKWIPFFLGAIFIALTASGLASMHNPDELIHRVAKALEGSWEFDKTNFDYPSLPKYVIFGVGKIAFALGFANKFYIWARFFSVLLGAGVVFLVYKITRELGGGILASSLASFFLITNSTIAINARFAHNDLYLNFFLTLTVYFLVLYRKKTQKSWLYAAFFSVGLAASSKYNGGIFILLPSLIFLITEGKNFFQEKLHSFETLFIGFVFSFLGFASGTPKALFWMSYYFKRVIPALSHHASYGKTSESVIGFWGQWGILKNALGTSVFILFLVAFLYFLARMLKKTYLFFRKVDHDAAKEEEKKQETTGNETSGLLEIIVLAIIIFDLPIMASYNYQARFFIPLMSFFSILAALFIENIQTQITQRKNKNYTLILPIILGAILFFSFLRVLSVRLLLQNDPRDIASEFIATLPKGTKLEHTMYPPELPLEHFKTEYSYPIFFIKFEGQEVPEVGRGKPYKKFNEGEAGLLKRETDYFVIDSFTYARCENQAIYKTNPVECDFFKNLLAGKTSYRLIGDFTYSLPPFLPQITIAFVNPEIQIFQKSE